MTGSRRCFLGNGTGKIMKGSKVMDTYNRNIHTVILNHNFNVLHVVTNIQVCITNHGINITQIILYMEICKSIPGPYFNNQYYVLSLLFFKSLQKL